MKLISTLAYSLVICFGFTGIAEAKGRSGSFKDGFSSQKYSAPNRIKRITHRFQKRQ